MRAPFYALLLACVYLLIPCSSKAVELLAKQILPSTRIIGALSMYKRVCTNEKIVQDIVCELTNVDKTVFGELKNLENQVKGMSTVSDFYEKTPTVNSKDLDKTLDGFGRLTGLKKHEANLKKEFISEAAQEIARGVNVSVTIMNARKGIDKTEFSKVEIILKDINGDGGEQTAMVSKIKDLRLAIDYFQPRLTGIINYKTEYSDFLSLRGMDKKTENALTVVTAIKEIFDNFEAIKVFDSIAPTLKKQMSKLRTELSEFEKHSATVSSAGESMKAINRLSVSSATRVLTHGLPNGASDLKQLPNDVKSTWFLENLVKDSDPSAMKNALQTISKSSVTLEAVQAQRSKLSGDQHIQKDYLEFVTKANELVVIGKRATQNDNAETTLESMVLCIAEMAQLDKVPELKSTEDVANYVKAAVKLVVDFEKVAEEVVGQKGLKEFQNDLDKLISSTNTITLTPTLDETKDAWKAVKELKLLEKYDSIWKSLQKFDQNPFYLKAEKLPTEILNEALQSAEKAKIFAAVKCLPPTATDISDVINFGRKFAELKVDKPKLTAALPVLKNALDFSTSVSKAAAELKKLKTQDETSVVCDLPEDFDKNVAPFVLTGDFINDLEKVEQSEAAVMVVASPSDPVKQAAEKIPGSDFYNNEFRKNFTGALNELEEILKLMNPVKTFDDLKKLLGKIAPKTAGIKLKDISKLKNPLATELAKNQDPEIKEAAESFDTVSQLNMDYSKYSSGLALKEDLPKKLESVFNSNSKSGGDSTKHLSLIVVPLIILGIIIIIIVFVLLRNLLREVCKQSRTMSLTVDPPACTVPAAGGASTHKLVNGGADKLIFKIKSSNNTEYRVSSVFGFVDPSGSKDITITRTAGAPKEDKLVIQFANAPADATDAQAAFAAVTPAGTLTIPLSATA